MDQIWIPVLIGLLIFALVYGIAYYSRRVGKTTRRREILVRVGIVLIIFIAPAIATGNYLPAMGIGICVLIPMVLFAAITWSAKNSMYAGMQKQQKQ
jgi:hypothetical protein